MALGGYHKGRVCFRVKPVDTHIYKHSKDGERPVTNQPVCVPIQFLHSIHRYEQIIILALNST